VKHILAYATSKETLTNFHDERENVITARKHYMKEGKAKSNIEEYISEMKTPDFEALFQYGEFNLLFPTSHLIEGF
jgi:hypothetical protein